MTVSRNTPSPSCSVTFCVQVCRKPNQTIGRIPRLETEPVFVSMPSTTTTRKWNPNPSLEKEGEPEDKSVFWRIVYHLFRQEHAVWTMDAHTQTQHTNTAVDKETENGWASGMDQKITMCARVDGRGVQKET